MTQATNVTTYEQTFPLSAEPSRIFAALTDAGQLRRWFSQHVSIEPRVGGAFKFWGKHTPWTRTERDAQQKITAIEQDKKLAFHWPWAGSVGEVILALAADGGGCSLHVRHETRGPIFGYGPQEAPWVLKDFWTLSIGNLREFLKHGEPALRPDFSNVGGDVVMSIVINAPTSAVWNALTDPRELDRWLSEKARISLKQGGEYSYGWLQPDSATPIGPSRLLAIEPGRRLVHDWAYKDDATIRTEWSLEPIGDQVTRLTVRQVGTGDERESGGYANGWGRFLLRAKALLEGMPLY